MNTKLKPFNLQAALNGEPVMLRDGSKAFVRHHETELPVIAHSYIWGAVAQESGEYMTKTWSKNGCYVDETVEQSLDIIGMYPKTRIINGFEVPAPEVKEPEDDARFFVVDVLDDGYRGSFRWSGLSSFHKRALSRGLVFLSKEDAIANAKAMLGINPYEEATNEPE